jgi:hypothetical protein
MHDREVDTMGRSYHSNRDAGCHLGSHSGLGVSQKQQTRMCIHLDILTFINKLRLQHLASNFHLNHR